VLRAVAGRAERRVALTATIYNFEIELADTDRGVYETLSLKVARHPSETPEHMVTRVLAYCLELTEGIGFSRGLAHPDDPAISVRDLTGALLAWIDVGMPDASRLHRASKAAPRVAVYTHKPQQLLNQLAGERIHRSDGLELYAIDPGLLSGLVSLLERRMKLALSVTGAHLFLSVGEASLAGEVARLAHGT
jgi:uncharacterized protein YaeQ